MAEPVKYGGMEEAGRSDTGWGGARTKLAKILYQAGAMEAAIVAQIQRGLTPSTYAPHPRGEVEWGVGGTTVKYRGGDIGNPFGSTKRWSLTKIVNDDRGVGELTIATNDEKGT